jgi:hypothetical protein
VDHPELAVAMLYVREGHDVTSLRELPGRGRTADFLVCGTPLEVKSWLPIGLRAEPPQATSVANKLLQSRGQGSTAVLWGPSSGLNETTARAGYKLFCARAAERGLGKLRSVRIIGKGFDISLAPSLDVRRADRLGPLKPGPGQPRLPQVALRQPGPVRQRPTQLAQRATRPPRLVM